MNPRPIITLTTDFGLTDAYVSAMKGVILGIAPRASIVDVSHDVLPQNIAQASYLLESVYRYFPPDAVHVAVVDPGVGTSRAPLAMALPHGLFVGPDNGIFGGVLIDQDAIELPGGILRQGRAVRLANEALWHRPVSNTFHGRDIFAPSAAHLARGIPLHDLGPELPAVQHLPAAEARRKDGCVEGAIVHIDRFGNAVSNVPVEMVPAAPEFRIAGRTLHGLSSSYQDSEVAAIVGSMGRVEIAVRNGSAAQHLGIGVGDILTVGPAT